MERITTFKLMVYHRGSSLAREKYHIDAICVVTNGKAFLRLGLKLIAPFAVHE